MSYMKLGGGSLVMPVYHSEDGGQTWTQSSFSTLTAIRTDKETSGQQLLGGGDPVLAYDTEGRLWFSYISLTNGSKGLLFICWMAYSDNNGVSFKQDRNGRYLGRAKIVGNSIDLNYGNGLLDRQWLVVDNSKGPNRGKMYLSGVYLGKGQSTNAQIMVITKEHKDLKFPNELNPVSDAHQPQFAHMTIDDNGTLHLVYCTIATGELFYQQSSDGGKTFSEAVPIDFLTYNKQATVKATHQRENPMPQIAASKDGQTLYVSWTDFEAYKASAYISSSKDGGVTWERTFDLSDLSDWGGNSLMPTIAINSEGDLVASWYAINNNLEGQFTIGVQLHNQDKFESAPLFTSEEKCDFKLYRNAQSDFFGDYLNSVTQGTKTYTVFADGRNRKGPKLYLAVTDHFGLNTSITPINVSPLTIESVLPTPASSLITIRLNQVINERARIRWVNMEGDILKREARPIEGDILHLEVPERLVNGTYILQLQLKDKMVSTKVLVSR